jgi:hypothetical protein
MISPLENPPKKTPGAHNGATGGATTIHNLDRVKIDAEKIIDLETIGEDTTPDFFHAPSERFLVRNPAGRWLAVSSASYRRMLAGRGVATSRASGEAMAEADHVILQTQLENDIARYGPLCGRDAGFYEENGIRHLVTERMDLIEPRRGRCPVISRLLDGLLVDGETPERGEAQRHALLGWLQSSVRALRAGRFQQQQALAIAGPRDCGKSLLQHHIITPCLAGRAVNGERYFLKGNDFNGDLYGGEHVTIDDSAASIRIGDRLAFGARLKGATVGASVGALHGKGRDAIALRPWWRITITCNDDPECLLVLPPLNADVADKLILLRASQFALPMPTGTQSEREAFAAAIRAEIPAFLFFLLEAYELPEEYTDPRRYGVATYHHPELAEALDGLSPEAELLDLIDATISSDLDHGPVWIAAADLETKIRDRHPNRASKVFTYRQACAKYLHRLSIKHPERVRKQRTHTANGWQIMRSVEGVEGK